MKRLLSFILIILSLGFVQVNAQSLGSMDEPPRLRDLEPLLVQLVYLIWAMGGIIFTVILMIIGFLYMISGGDPQKKEELKKRAKNWIIGLIIFFVGYPVVATVYSVLGIGQTNPECYKKISTPGFHFFFPEVCTDPLDGTRTGLGAAVDPSLVTPEFIERLKTEQKCLVAGKFVINNGDAYYSTSSEILMSDNNTGADGQCLGTPVTRFGSASSVNFQYAYDGTNLYKEEGVFYKYGAACTDSEVEASTEAAHKQTICCHSDLRKVVPSLDEGQEGTPRYVRFSSTGKTNLFWYDDTDNTGAKGSCDCETESGQCKDFTGVSPTVIL